MSAHRPEHLELCAGFVLGVLDAADRREFETHLASGCAECRNEVARLEEAALLLASSAPAAAPSAGLRERTLAAIAREPQASVSATRPVSEPRVIPMPAPRRPVILPWAFAAAAAVLAVVTIGLWREGDRLRDELVATRKQLAETAQRLLEERQWTAVLDGMNARAVSLSLTPDGAPDLRGRATWDPDTRRAIIVFEHVVAPTGRDYELWGLHPSGPKSLGVIHPDASGRAIVRLEDAGDPTTLQAFAISLEPAGGSPNPNAPTGPVVMVGKVSG